MQTAPVVETLSQPERYIGLMSGTSLDGVDGVLVTLHMTDTGLAVQTEAAAYLPFGQDLRAGLLELQAATENEIHREAMLSGLLAHCYADCIAQLLKQAEVGAEHVRAVGVHGQTIRHRPECGYTRQINQPALLAELCGIDVIADFRSRDIAAGGHGAPLAPAFHQAVFARPDADRVVLNIGGIANISLLRSVQGNIPATVQGFDTGPGNVLMDAWIARHQAKQYDAGGLWAASGTADPHLLQRLLQDPYFQLPAPKTTGRDLFNAEWLDHHLSAAGNLSAATVQATLLALTVETICTAIRDHAEDIDAVYVCGGGAHNFTLIKALAARLDAAYGKAVAVESTAALGVPPEQVEALAFAWLAQRFTHRLPGNLPTVTGAKHPCILGALYPA